jgi:hypothetical protein
MSAGGNVGIGTSSPSNLLTISDATTAKLELNRNGAIGNGWIVSTDNAANEEVAIQMYNSEFRLYNNSTQNFTVTSGGNVGIGTNSPTNVSNYNSISVDGTTGSLIDSYYGGTLGGRIQAYSSKYLISAQGASLPLALGTNNTERMRIDASGNLLVGTTSTSLPATDAFVFLNNGEFRAGNDATSGGSNVELNRENSDGDFIRFYRAGSEVGSIGAKSSALVIGTEDTALRFFDSVDKIYPATTDGSIRDALIGLGNSNARFTDLYLSGRANLSNGSYVTFGDISTAIYGSNSLNLLTFTTNSSEKMRLDGSGNLLVGKTSAAIAGAGTAILSSGTHNVTVNGDTTLQLNRLTSNGAIATFFKDSITVGSIGCDSNSNFMLGQGDTGLSFQPSSDRIIPRNTDGSGRDAAIDLGGTGNRFKDLYLSGGVYLGGTGSANHLDDYEEGTWTPTQGSFTTWTSPTFDARYTKVGRMVFINLRQTGGTIGWSSQQQMGGLPFAPSQGASAYATDDGPVSDNGALLIWTASNVYFQKSNASETSLVFSAMYYTSA